MSPVWEIAQRDSSDTSSLKPDCNVKDPISDQV